MILEFVANKPGLSEQDIISHFANCFPPVVVSELLKILARYAFVDRYWITEHVFVNILEEKKERKSFHYFPVPYWYLLSEQQIVNNLQLQSWSKTQFDEDVEFDEDQ